LSDITTLFITPQLKKSSVTIQNVLGILMPLPGKTIAETTIKSSTRKTLEHTRARRIAWIRQTGKQSNSSGQTSDRSEQSGGDALDASIESTLQLKAGIANRANGIVKVTDTRHESNC
jgi:hypothetical protein